jgi:hypothetical protein
LLAKVKLRLPQKHGSLPRWDTEPDPFCSPDNRRHLGLHLQSFSAEMNGQVITVLLQVRSEDDGGWQDLRAVRIAMPETESRADVSQT